jgi:hypothetical protein
MGIFDTVSVVASNVGDYIDSAWGTTQDIVTNPNAVIPFFATPFLARKAWSPVGSAFDSLSGPSMYSVQAQEMRRQGISEEQIAQALNPVNPAETAAVAFGSNGVGATSAYLQALAVPDLIKGFQAKLMSGQPLTSEDQSQFENALTMVSTLATQSQTVPQVIQNYWDQIQGSTATDVADPNYASNLLTKMYADVQTAAQAPAADAAQKTYADQLAQSQALDLQTKQDVIKYNQMQYERDSIAAIMGTLPATGRTPFLVSLLQQPHYAELFFPTQFGSGGSGQTAWDNTVGAMGGGVGSPPPTDASAGLRAWAATH